MKKLDIFTIIGLAVYFVSTMIKRFVIEIPDYIYIPIMVVATILIIVGIVKNRKEKQ